MGLVQRSEINVKDTWDLSPLYPSLEAWQEHYRAVELKLPRIAEFEGHLGVSAEVLRQGLELDLSLSREIEKLYTYAHMKSDEDTANSLYLGTLDQATNIYARYSALSSFITPEILAIDPAVLDSFIADPALSGLKRLLRETIRFRPHTLSKSEEALLAQGIEVFESCTKVFSQLNNADLEFGSLPLDGVDKPLTHGNFALFMKNQNRETRRAAHEKYYSVYEAHKNTIAASLAGAIKRDIYLSKVKNYSSALDAALFRDNVVKEVYTNLIGTVSEFLEPLHRYYQVRKELLGLDTVNLYDTYVPLVSDVKTCYPFPQAVETVLASLRPLGEDYTSTLRRGLTAERWVDIYENKGKRSGAYSSGCYDSFPYLLLNYKEESINDLFTLAHEAGHSMHSYHSAKHQPFQDFRYTIFVAEVASTFNEQLLLHHLKQQHRDNKTMLAYLLNHQLDEIKGTLYRQTMFAEFEMMTHDLAEKNESLTIDTFREIYSGLLRKYFGPAVVFSERDPLECLRIPHFYHAFYVYKYSTGISAAITLAQKVLNGSAADRDRYLNFLRGGCSKYPLELLRDAGVDMTSPEPIRTALKGFAEVLDQLTATLKS